MASESTVLRPLGTEGRRYFTEHWEMGHSLSGSLLNSGPFAAGSVFASVPEETTEARSTAFTSGWLHRSSDVGDVHRLISDVLNGPTEAANNLIKRVAFGFRRFRNSRIRTLVYVGRPNWDLLATITPR
jgi:hypothetical protein